MLYNKELLAKHSLFNKYFSSCIIIEWANPNNNYI